jgi:hypothetical protein
VRPHFFRKADSQARLIVIKRNVVFINEIEEEYVECLMGK